MCGIAGIVQGPGSRIADAARLRESLIHRGPDDWGEFADGDCALGMRRLSIIDLAGGHQPLTSESRTITCVSNGEIYNYRPLRDELRAAGHDFATASDIEVIPHGYEAWGTDVVRRLNGMFAIAVWDAPRRRLVLARDRLGKKPLYYSRRGNGLAFASELRALLALPGERWTVDREACRRFCEAGWMPDDRTPIAEIRRLPPGHLGIWEQGAWRMEPYWKPEPAPAPSSRAQAVGTLSTLFRDAVSCRLMSDVPLGAFLSGGLDSSLIVAMAAGELGARIPTFTVTFPGLSHFDEAEHARAVARHFGCVHEEIPLTPDVFEKIDDLVWSLDEPLADVAALPTLLLSRAAKRSVTVVLTGEGADEVFGGYDRYRLAVGGARWGHIPLTRGAARAALASLGRRAADDSTVSRLLRAAAGKSDSLSWSRSLRQISSLAVRAPTLFSAENGSGLDESLRSIQLDDLAGPLLNGLLVKVDRMTMAASVEARCPFLDYRLVEFGLGLPSDLKTTPGRGKIVLREMAERLLPDRIRRRPKHTFRLPIADWMRSGRPLWHLVVGLAESTALYHFDVASEETVSRLAAEHGAGVANHGRALWALITLDRWLSAASARVELQAASEMVSGIGN